MMRSGKRMLVLCVAGISVLLAACQSAAPQGAQAAAVPVAPPAAIATAIPPAAPTIMPTPESEVSNILPSAAPTTIPAPPPVQTPQVTETTAPTPTMKEEQPPLLSNMLKKYSLSIEDIEGEQLLMLGYAPGKTRLYLYAKADSGLWKLTGSFAANVGSNGVTDNKAEGDKATPTGYYGIGFAFGIQAKPDTAWTYRAVTPDSYWVDDPDSAYYNTWVEGTQNKDWRSAEHLIDATTAYAYAMVIEYNMDPPIPGKGSAIFLHVGDHPTVGCISVAQADVLSILQWLKPEADPHILIADIQ